MKIALIRCPQPMLVGKETGALYSPNRALTPEPTLPQLEGIIHASRLDIKVEQIDLRSPWIGPVEETAYGELTLPYIKELAIKTFAGVSLQHVIEKLSEVDIVGFTNNFAMSRRVVANHIAEVRRLFPYKEIWVGGRDIFTDRVIDVYAEAAGRRNFVVFHGHVFYSLPAYLRWKTQGVGDPFGITLYDADGQVAYLPPRPLNQGGSREIAVPLPVFPRPGELGYFTGSGEGQADPPFGRFAHLTITVGCPQACEYCTTGYRERFLICKDMQTIEVELELYQQLGVTHLAIMDDNLLALGPNKVREVMEMVNSYGFKLEYGNGLQLSLLDRWWDELADVIFDRCVSVYAPLEDLTTDRLYNKLHPTAQQLDLMQRISREKPGSLRYVTMGVILGVPGHTQKALGGPFMRKAEKFLEAFQGSPLEVAMTVFSFMPLPGTTFGENALDSGRMVVTDPISVDPEVCNFGTTSYAPEGMTHAEIFRLYKQALNLNPAGRELSISYVDLQRLGEHVLPEGERHRIPPQWRTPGMHLRARVT